MKYSAIIALLLLCSCSSTAESGWTDLLDDDLSHWDNYLSYYYANGYNGKAPKDESGNDIAPIGLNQKGYDVFSVNLETDEPILRISGEVYGCLVTKKVYANYHLRLKVKWGDLKWPLRKNKLKDSGILYHSYGPHGAEYFRSWMLGQEFQVMEGHMGDYWNQVNTAADIRAVPPEGMINGIADASYPFLGFGKNALQPGFCKASANFESAENDWTTLELITFEDKSIHIVNGEVVMVLKNSRYFENNQKHDLIKGKIQLQSEAAEVFYKNIEIKAIASVPVEFGHYFL